MAVPPSVCVFDVVVIGGGLSGLAIADELSRAGESEPQSKSEPDAGAAGWSVVVVEGRDRVGGRLSSMTSSCVPESEARFDLGATWFWPGESRVSELVGSLGLAVHTQATEGDVVYEVAQGDVVRASGALAGGGGTSWRVVQGTAAIAEALAGQLPAGVLKTGWTATHVRVQDGVAVVSSDGGEEVRGRAVVLALPPATAVASIEFDPPLDERVAAVAGSTPVWMGTSGKVVAEYAAPFWREKGLSGYGVSRVGPLMEVHDACGPDGSPAALFAFTGTPAPSQDEAVAHLVRLFGPEAGQPTVVTIADWSTEPLTSPPNVTELGDYGRFGHKVFQSATLLDGTVAVYWASTETGGSVPGHMEGALSAAQRTVMLLKRSRGP